MESITRKHEELCARDFIMNVVAMLLCFKPAASFFYGLLTIAVEHAGSISSFHFPPTKYSKADN